MKCATRKPSAETIAADKAAYRYESDRHNDAKRALFYCYESAEKARLRSIMTDARRAMSAIAGRDPWVRRSAGFAEKK